MHDSSLAEVFGSISRFMPGTIVSSLEWDVCLALAARLPALVCPGSFGFETRLNEPSRHADFAFCVTQPGSDILAGTYPLDFPSPVLSDPRAWPGIKAFCRKWGDPSSGVSSRVANLWLEYRTRSAEKDPIPFIKLREDPSWKTWLSDMLGLLYGKPIPARVLASLGSLLARLPPHVRVFQAGIAEPDGECAIRLCIEGIAASELQDAAGTIVPGMKLGPGFFDDLLPSSGRTCVHLDVGESVGSSIGVEIRQSKENELCLDTQSEWDRVLDVLAAKGLCTREWAGFLGGFHGYSYEAIRGLEQYVTYRYLYYLKAVFVKGKCETVKAYFGFVNRIPVPRLEKHPVLFMHTGLSDRSIEGAIRRGVTFLVQNQLPHGEFKTFLSHDPLLEHAQYDSSPFVTAFVLYCTRTLADGRFIRPREKALSFLLSEASPGFLWKYWTRASAKAIACDLDDTACISHLIRDSFGIRDVEQNIPAILSNRDESGLFRTWISDGNSGEEPDMAVNANVLLYLGERPETSACLALLRERVLGPGEAVHSAYYPDPVSVYYMLARAAFHGVRSLSPLFPVMRERVLERIGHDCGHMDELSIAMAVSALRYMDTDQTRYERARLRLIETQQPNGSWRRIAFYSGPEAPQPRSVWFGSEESTTAFCLQALLPPDL